MPGDGVLTASADAPGPAQRRLLLDEQLGPSLMSALLKRGMDAACVVEMGELVGASDEAVLTFATQDRRTVVTRDHRDYRVLDQLWRERSATHFGLVLLTENAFPQTRDSVGSVVRALLAADLPEPGGTLYLRPVERS